MLFDLRAPGRKRLIQVVYLTLAILMGGGLVFFGIGGDVQGGLFDAFGGNSGQSADDTLEKRVETLEKRVAANPAQEAAWAQLARARYQLAGTGDNYDRNTNTFTDKGVRALRGVDQAWTRYLALEPKKPDDTIASLMVQAYSEVGLNDAAKAVSAQEIVTEARPSSNAYVQLAYLAYLAEQDRKGDLASKQALELADEDDRKALRERLEQLKTQATSAGQQTTTG